MLGCVYVHTYSTCGEERKTAGAALLFLPICAHVCWGCASFTQGLHYVCACEWNCCEPLSCTQWHFPSSGCSPDIFLVSDQSWFSQMSHSLRYTSLNEGSATAFAKTQTSKRKLIFPYTAKSSVGNRMILMFAYIVQIHINVFLEKTGFMMTLEIYVNCWHPIKEESEKFVWKK